jgi:hypothetical protein
MRVTSFFFFFLPRSLHSFFFISRKNQKISKLVNVLGSLMNHFNSTDLEATIKVTGYHFDTPTFLEGIDNVAIAHGIRYANSIFI